MGGLLSVAWGWVTAAGKAGSIMQPEEGSLGPYADVPDKTTGLTLRHRTAIYRTWDLVRPNVKLHGPNFFRAMFEAEPILQTRFKSFIGKTKEELKKDNKRLVAHGTTVFMAITSLVDNLEDVPVLVELIKNTANNHIRHGVPKEDFEMLPPILLKFMRDTLGSAWSPVAEEGWSQAVKVIISVILSVYDE
ncbi:hypothetical protein O3P69_006682 [Scylla paramamosain]|uniref:Globin domain-containing protein n=1 Tax=Scylla paramamosain TaxID=85552 RepID=A0AAW0U537_SCYPA